MHLVACFCVCVFFLYCVQNSKAVPISNDDYIGPIMEVDGNELEYIGSYENTDDEVKYVTAFARNKRSYDYFGTYSSESDEDGYGYIPKPVQYYHIQYWTPSPPGHGNHGFWPPGHLQQHKKNHGGGSKHHKNDCKYPNHGHDHYHSSSEYDNYDYDNYHSFGKFGHGKSTTTTIRNFPKDKTTTSVPNIRDIFNNKDGDNNVPSDINIPSLPPSISSTTSTSTTESVPFTSTISSSSTNTNFPKEKTTTSVPNNVPSSTNIPSLPPSISTTEGVPFTSIISSSSTTTTTTTESGPIFDIRQGD